MKMGFIDDLPGGGINDVMFGKGRNKMTIWKKVMFLITSDTLGYWHFIKQEWDKLKFRWAMLKRWDDNEESARFIANQQNDWMSSKDAQEKAK